MSAARQRLMNGEGLGGGHGREGKPGRVQGVGSGVEYHPEQGNPGIELASQQGADTAMPLTLAWATPDAMYICLEEDPRHRLACGSGIAPATGPWLLASDIRSYRAVATVAMCTICTIYWGRRQVGWGLWGSVADGSRK